MNSGIEFLPSFVLNYHRVLNPHLQNEHSFKYLKTSLFSQMISLYVRFAYYFFLSVPTKLFCGEISSLRNEWSKRRVLVSGLDSSVFLNHTCDLGRQEPTTVTAKEK